MKETDVCCQPDEREASATGECPGLWDNGHLGSATLRVTGEKAQPLPGCCLLSAQELGPLGNLLYLSDRYISIYKQAFFMDTKKKNLFAQVLPLANITVSRYTCLGEKS